MIDPLEKATNVIKSGGIVIFPTDTAFGIGCRIDNETTVTRLFNIRKRPNTKATPVLVSSIEMAREWVDEVSPKAEKLMKEYWPGGLTIVLPSTNEKVPGLVKGGGDTLGVRMPDHQEILQLISNVGVPILAPSANLAKEETPFTVDELNPKLVRLVDFVLPGECKFKQPSTVVDTTVNPVKVLREGAVKLETRK